MKTSGTRPERRQANRAHFPEKVTFEVSTHLSSHGPHEPSPSGRLFSQIKNVSEGGICLSTKEPLTASQVIKISLPLPHVKITTPTLAEVRWVKRDPQKDLYFAGLRFLL